jgi:hypothetical protein
MRLDESEPPKLFKSGPDFFDQGGGQRLYPFDESDCLRKLLHAERAIELIEPLQNKSAERIQKMGVACAAIVDNYLALPVAPD